MKKFEMRKIALIISIACIAVMPFQSCLKTPEAPEYMGVGMEGVVIYNALLRYSQNHAGDWPFSLHPTINQDMDEWVSKGGDISKWAYNQPSSTRPDPKHVILKREFGGNEKVVFWMDGTSTFYKDGVER